MGRPSIVPGLALEEALDQTAEAMAVMIVDTARTRPTEDDIRTQVHGLLMSLAAMAGGPQAQPWDIFCAHLAAKNLTNPEQARRWTGSLVARTTPEALRLYDLRAAVRAERRRLTAAAA